MCMKFCAIIPTKNCEKYNIIHMFLIIIIQVVYAHNNNLCYNFFHP